MRRIITWNGDWRFSKNMEMPKDFPVNWERVQLPHTWNALDGQDGGNDYWRGTATYVKQFVKPEFKDGERVIIEFQGVSMTADVYLNGTKLAHHEGGFSTFRADMTDSLADDNLLCVFVDNSINNHVYPQKADFTFYGGIYRDVKLLIIPDRHFELLMAGTPGIKVTPKVDLYSNSASVTVETWQNDEEVTITVNGQSKTVRSVDGHAIAEFTIQEVHLWDGVDDPYLYEASARLSSRDEIRTRFGCRTFSFDPEKGFFLNGRSYPLRGVSRHQDREGIGNALTPEMQQEDMEIIREIGANTVRLAHYQQSQEFYDLCDTNGVIVWAEIPYITQHMPDGRQNTLDQMRDLITQCYNHPSIICWGISNEISVNGISEDLLENHRILNELCHEMDKTRPTTMAHAFMLEQESPLTGLTDISSYNLYFGWYLGSLEQNDRFFDEYHRKYPDRIMGFSEYGADANPQFQSAEPEQGDYSEQYQCKYHEYLLSTIERHPWLWATYCWNLFDFAADGRDEGGKRGVNQKGLVTMDRKQKKDAFYLYKAIWNKKSLFIHLCGSRYIDRPENETEIKVYSNLPEISLFVDGRLLETKKGDGVFIFRVKISGEHRIEAKSGEIADTMLIRKVEQPNPDYHFSRSDGVANWFDEADFHSGYFSIRDSFGTLTSDPRTSAIVEKVMQRMVASRGDVAKSANGNANLQKMMAGMSMQSLIRQAGDAVPQELVQQLNRELQQIPKE